ncbi:hypothetical protein DRO97_10260, partial [Archaeoglobales archaeon]
QTGNKENTNTNVNLDKDIKGDGGGNIYGEASIASLENTANIEFRLGGVEMNTRLNIESYENANQEIETISPIAAEAYHENIPQIYEEVVKRYFEKLRVEET